MFAVIKTGGKQYRVQEGEVLDIEKIKVETGQTVSFEQVLLIDDGQTTLLGTPYLENAAVRAEVLGEFKGEKVLVFKKKRRKQYRRTRGHRQLHTRVKIDRILTDASSTPVVHKEKPAVRPKETEVPVEAAPAKPAVEEPKKTARKAAKTAVKAPAKPKKAPVKEEAKPKKKPAVKKAKG